MVSSSERLSIAVNSLSAASYELGTVRIAGRQFPELRSVRDIVLPPYVTEQVGKRVVVLAHRLRESFGSPVQTVLHASRTVNAPELAAYIQELGVGIAGVDVADVYPSWKLPLEILQTSGKAAIRRSDIRRVVNHVGWALNNVGSASEQRRIVRQGLEADTDNSKELQIVLADASSWLREPRRGEKLEEELLEYQSKTGRQVALAIEMLADMQTPAAFLEFIQRKWKDNKDRGGIEIFADIDLGHVARARDQKTHEGKGIPHPEDFLKQTLQNQQTARLVRVISFNQHKTGEEESHAPLKEGSIDLVEASRIVGTAFNEGRLSSAIVLFEPSPLHYKWFFSEEGVRFCQKMGKAINQTQSC